LFAHAETSTAILAVWGDDIYVANLSTGVVGKYTTDGAIVDASLISGFPGLTALTVADGFLYVVDAVNGTVGKYNLDGTVVNAGLVIGLGSTPGGIAISGTDLFVANPGNSTIGKYTTDGGIINREFIIDVPDPRRLAVAAGVLYVSNYCYQRSIQRCTRGGVIGTNTASAKMGRLIQYL
jgi:Uncharacterized conserved protein